MSFLSKIQQLGHKIDPVDRAVSSAVGLNFKPKNPAPTPGVPDPNQAANNAQNLTDQMRMRRGLMANIYAGAGGPAPVTGKTQLGT
jgi:hypothetical protein